MASASNEELAQAPEAGRTAVELSVAHEWYAPQAPVVSPLDDETLAPDVRCILALSAELLSYGLPVHRVEESVLRLSRAFGRRATVMGLPTTLSVSFQEPRSSTAHLVRAEPGVVHLARLDALHKLVGRVERSELDATRTLAEIRAIVRTAHPRSLARELACAGLVGAGGVQLLGGSPIDSLLAACLAIGTGSLALLASLRPLLTRITPVIAAILVTLCCAALAHTRVIVHPLVVTLGSLLVLLPGLTLTLATVELATGHLVCGTARLVGAATTFVQLGFGTLVGVRLGALAALEPVPHEVPPLWLEAAGAAALATGFAGLLSVRRTDALATAFVSALAWGTNRLLGPAIGAEIAVLTAMLLVGLSSNGFARFRDRPSSILLAPGIVMLVPGSLGMVSISSALLHDPGKAIAAVTHMFALTMALTTGVLVASALVPPRTEL